MANLVIVADITAKPEKIELVKSELEKLVPITLREAGCVQYDLHQDNENPAHFLFFEIWESRDLWQQHMQAEHLREYAAATDGAVEDFAVYEMTQVGTSSANS